MAAAKQGPRVRGDIGCSDDYFAITPSDTVDLDTVIRALVVASGGNIVLTKANGQDVTLTLPAGLFPIRATRVKATGTTASGLTGIV